ncbi:MAG: hypothetical protein FWC95_07560 [Defluviitaleaceae bacterium]|nr:hypothetical protein [Defluviitaleaceae bacterium]
MKKVILIIAIMLAAGLFSACRDSDEGGSAGDGRATARLPFPTATDGFVFVHNGVTVVMGGTVHDTVQLPEFGAPLDLRHEPSCAFEGFDKSFIFADFLIEAFPFNDLYYVNMIVLRNDNVSTREGLRIGMTYDDMVRLIGSGYAMASGARHVQYTFARGGMRLEFLINNDSVIEQISYHLNLPE